MYLKEKLQKGIKLLGPLQRLFKESWNSFADYINALYKRKECKREEVMIELDPRLELQQDHSGSFQPFFASDDVIKNLNECYSFGSIYK